MAKMEMAITSTNMNRFCSDFQILILSTIHKKNINDIFGSNDLKFSASYGRGQNFERLAPSFYERYLKIVLIQVIIISK